MKLRIRGNSIRFRLTKSEVHELESTGYLEETIIFPGSVLTYCLRKENRELNADFSGNKITVTVPENFVNGWPQNNTVGMGGSIETSGGELKLLIEKDFVCLDETSEDQSDNYPNPNSIC